VIADDLGRLIEYAKPPDPPECRGSGSPHDCSHEGLRSTERFRRSPADREDRAAVHQLSAIRLLGQAV
jgi:hypothetical protein